MQREEMELLAVRATLWRMEIELLREIHRYRFAKRGRRFGSDLELMIVYGAAMAHYGFGTPVRALPISRYLEMPRETVRRVDWWRSVCLNAQRIKPSSLARNSIRLRLSAPYDCFARELRDYYDGALRATSSASYARSTAAPVGSKRRVRLRRCFFPAGGSVWHSYLFGAVSDLSRVVESVADRPRFEAISCGYVEIKTTQRPVSS